MESQPFTAMAIRRRVARKHRVLITRGGRVEPGRGTGFSLCPGCSIMSLGEGIFNEGNRLAASPAVRNLYSSASRRRRRRRRRRVVVVSYSRVMKRARERRIIARDIFFTRACACACLETEQRREELVSRSLECDRGERDGDVACRWLTPLARPSVTINTDVRVFPRTSH
jgi:hypothetical protein